ncbi:ankyrin repeat-containing domain protein, partial [Corynascus similis CBS 632.67]
SQASDGKTQLHQAVISKDPDLVKTLLYAGAAVNVRDHAENDPLHYAVLYDLVDIVKLLLRFGADPDAQVQLDRSPLHLAI